MQIKKKENIISIEFGEYCTVNAPSLVQYDTGQILKLDDVDEGTEIQFCNETSEETVNKIVQNGQVAIPDFLLQEAQLITAYVQIINEDSSTTVKTVFIPVMNKIKPGEYVTPEDEQSFREEMQGIMNETKAIAEETKEAMENFELSDEKIVEIAKNIDLSGYVPTSRQIAGKELSADITSQELAKAISGTSEFMLGVGNSMIIQRNVDQFFENENVINALSSHVPTTRKVANQPLTEDITPLQIINAILNDSNSFKQLTDRIGYLYGYPSNLETINKNNLVVAINEVNSLAKKANKAISYTSYANMINAINNIYITDVLEVGQSIYIQQLDVPDLWVYGISTKGYVKYVYTTDQAFIEELNRVGFVQIGYHLISKLETQKVDLINYDTSDEVDKKITEAIGEILGGAS